MNLKKLFAGIAVMGASLGFFGHTEAQAQTKQTNKTEQTGKTTVDSKTVDLFENGVKVGTKTTTTTRDANGRVIATSSSVNKITKDKKVETYIIPGKKGSKPVATGPKMSAEAWKKFLAEESDEARARRKARENAQRVVATPDTVVKTIFVEVEKLREDQSDTLAIEKAPEIRVDTVIIKEPVVQTVAPAPRRPWIASAGAMVSSSLDKGSIYKGVATPGVFAAIQTPALAGSGIGSLVSVRAEVNAQFAKPVASATMNQSCNCVTIGTFNAAGSGPRYGGMLTAHIGKTFNLNRYIDVTPNVFVGGAFQTRDKFTMEKGKEWTPQQKKEQSTAFGVAGAGITVYGDFGGNPQRGLGVVFTANAMTTTQKAAHQNPYTGPVPNPGYGSEVQSGRSLSLQDKFNVSGRVGLAYKF